MSYVRRYLAAATVVCAIICLYLYRLQGVGVLDPDEPRYLAIGRTMAATRDFVTPRLWGEPWFEKPPLIYWLTSLGTAFHLSPELSGRLPVALMSLAFLGVMFELLRREFGQQPAAIASALLATSAGWLAYSSFALTDVPLSVCFSIAVFAALPLLRAEPEIHRLGLRLVCIGASLGLATLAKGLVPLVLALPMGWFLRRFWRKFWIVGLACTLVALPWYLLVYLRNGQPFLVEFFWKQHFERLYSNVLQHAQPWYYYAPVLLAALFPWIPLFGLLALRPPFRDRRRVFLAVIAVFGFVFFTCSLNKLPGYLLPLLPSLFALLGGLFEFRRLAQISRIWFVACGFLIGLLPVVTKVLPRSLELGRFSLDQMGHWTATQCTFLVAPVLVTLLARRTWIMPLMIVSVVFGGMLLKITTYPTLDRTVSARYFWRNLKVPEKLICNGGLDRHWDYGIAFYRGGLLPYCDSPIYRYELQSQGHGAPVLITFKR